MSIKYLSRKVHSLILHIPHASTTLPFKDGYLVGEELLQKEINKLTDWYTDDLFESSEDITVKVDFSRIFCDVERFVDDEQDGHSITFHNIKSIKMPS